MRLERVLVPDANNRPSLTVIRSLGSKGCVVFAGSPHEWSLGGASRYAAGVVSHPDPYEDPGGFVESLLLAVRRHDIGVIMPASDVTTNILIEYEAHFPRSMKLVLPPRDALTLAHDKIALMQIASRLDVPIPDGFQAGDSLLEDPRLEELGEPFILKPGCSRYLSGHEWKTAAVRVAQNRVHLRELLERHREYREIPFLVQKKVPGDGRGVFLLARDGELMCVFGHRRLREKPPWGGVSTLCETATPDKILVEYSARLMKHLKWSGVAMVEFKYDPATSQAWLMEINGRFWGSMQLAVASGVDFPWLVYLQEVLGQKVEAPHSIRTTRLWWIPGDLDSLFIRLKMEGFKSLLSVAGAIMRTRQGRPLDLDTAKAHDPIPFLFEAYHWLIPSRLLMRQHSAARPKAAN